MSADPMRRETAGAHDALAAEDTLVLARSLRIDEGGGRIAMLVMDGLGGRPKMPGERTELECARTPNLDRLALEGECGLHEPVASGITPGSGPGHLALFGYDPLRYRVGRGVLSALGSGFDLREGDVAARGNFCRIDEEGVIVDRRAGRLETKRARELCDKLSGIELGDGAELHVQALKEHRFLLVLRGRNLDDNVADTDPSRTGIPPYAPGPAAGGESSTVPLVDEFVARARERLSEEEDANMVLLRGFAKRPDWPTFPESFGLDAYALADYPMYRGVARLIGMQTLESESGLAGKLEAIKRKGGGGDFFFVHHKATDSRGEDGDFDAKVAEIERVDALVPSLGALGMEVIVVTGDHSTPAPHQAHSWHPVPTIVWSASARPDAARAFGEAECRRGSLGPRFRGRELMLLAMAHAGRLRKFGA